MPRNAKPLTAREVSTIKKSGTYFDGHGLALRVGTTGAKSWIFRYVGAGGKRHDLGLGPVHTIGLAEARELALACRKQRLLGHDPLQAKRAAEQDRRIDAAKKTLTFAEAAEAYIQAHAAGWRDPRAAPQWRSSLRDHANPVIGALPVDAIDTTLVMQCLSPIWTTRTETASRVRARIESILEWSRVAGYRDGENPARWKAHLENLLPKKNRVKQTKHHATLDYSKIGPFMTDLRLQIGVASRALEFVVLTACRVGEVINARWSEINVDARLWVIPAERMKTGQPHRVPLSEEALAIVEAMNATKRIGDDYLFPGATAGRPISASAIRLAMDRICADGTVHGMRACFRSWCADHGIARDLAEQCLAHAIGDAVEQAYNRTDVLERRRPVMAAWGRYCDGTSEANNVIPIDERHGLPERAA
jgi:integrase